MMAMWLDGETNYCYHQLFIELISQSSKAQSILTDTETKANQEAHWDESCYSHAMIQNYFI